MYGLYVYFTTAFLLYNMGFDIAYIRMGVPVRTGITEIAELFFSILSNPEGGSKIRDFSGSFL